MNNFWLPLLASVAFGWCYFRLLRGTGIPAGSLLGAAAAGFVLVFPQAGKFLTGMLVIAAVVIEVNHQRRMKAFVGSEMVFEGGGIRRGLMPPEAGALFDLPEKDLLVVGLVELLQKGLITYQSSGDGLHFRLSDLIRLDREILNPAEKMRARKAAARAARQVLTSTEDILIEVISQQEGQPAGDLATQIWARQLKTQAVEGVTGFDPAKTREYYDAYITHRLNGVAAGHFKAEEYAGWMALARVLGMLASEPLLAVVRKTQPAWLHEEDHLLAWLDKLRAELSD